jgi:hypothetical protein
LATLLRPDIAFAASLLARFQQKPSLVHWESAKHVLRYLKTTQSSGLSFSATSPTVVPTDNGVPQMIARPPNELFGYADASYAEDLSTRRSQTGYVFLLANAAISWHTSLQPTVAISSTEAEYLSIASAAKEALFLKNL